MATERVKLREGASWWGEVRSEVEEIEARMQRQGSGLAEWEDLVGRAWVEEGEDAFTISINPSRAEGVPQGQQRRGLSIGRMTEGGGAPGGGGKKLVGSGVGGKSFPRSERSVQQNLVAKGIGCHHQHQLGTLKAIT